MGLFGRFRAPSQGRASSTTIETDFRDALRRPVNPVPDVDDDEGSLEQTVRDHLERITASAAADIDSLSQEEFDAALTARLVSAERIRSTGLGFEYATRYAPHIDEVLTLDLPSAVITLPDSRIAESGRRVRKLVDVARTNLLTLLETTPVEVQRVADGKNTAWVVTGDSPYTASFARFLNDAIYRWNPQVDGRNGYVFALPNRHSFVFQSCTSAQEVRGALELVPEIAMSMHTEGISPVSRHTYHWVDRQISCLTEEDGNGGLTIHPTPFLETLLGVPQVRRAAG